MTCAEVNAETTRRLLTAEIEYCRRQAQLLRQYALIQLEDAFARPAQSSQLRRFAADHLAQAAAYDAEVTRFHWQLDALGPIECEITFTAEVS